MLRKRYFVIIANICSDCWYYLSWPHYKLNVLPVLLVFHSFIIIVDIIFIDPITRYLDYNVIPIFHIYLYCANDWCITYFPVCNLIYFSVTSSFRLVWFVSNYKLNPNSIRIYVPPFSLYQNLFFLSSLIFYSRILLECCIKCLCCMLVLWCGVCVLYFRVIFSVLYIPCCISMLYVLCFVLCVV